MQIELGKVYQTRTVGRVLIIEDLGAGRKRFVGQLIDHQGLKIKYFRNGAYTNAKRGGHPFDIISLFLM